jgi:hypothetical protein
MSVRKQAQGVVGGVDTHKDSHTVVALDPTGQWLGWAQFPTHAAGYRVCSGCATTAHFFATEWKLRVPMAPASHAISSPRRSRASR